MATTNGLRATITPDLNLTDVLVQLWQSDRQEALRVAAESGRANDAKVLRNNEERDRGRDHRYCHPGNRNSGTGVL